MTKTLPPPPRPAPVAVRKMPEPVAAKAPELPAAAADTQPPEPPQLSAAEFAMWLHQLALVFCACSGVFALVAARLAERPWLSAVFSAFVAACITAFAGTAVATALQHLCMPGKEKLEPTVNAHK